MAITFAYRSDQLNARFGAEGVEPGLVHQSTATIPAIVSDAGAIGGNHLDLNSGTNILSLLFPGISNIPSTQAMSILIRFKFLNENLNWKRELFGMGVPTRILQSFFFSAYYLKSSTQLTLRWGDAQGGLDSINSTQDIDTNTWIDAVFQWDGTSGTDSVKIHLDAVEVDQKDSTKSISSRDNNQCPYFSLGGGTFQSGEISGILVNECVIWDEIIDPTSVTLTGGAGLLNGASRTEFVEANESQAAVFPAITDVRSGVTYGSDGDDQTGTLEVVSYTTDNLTVTAGATEASLESEVD